MKKATEEILAIALAVRSSLRRAALLLLAVDGALDGGRRAESEDEDAINEAMDKRPRAPRRYPGDEV